MKKAPYTAGCSSPSRNLDMTGAKQVALAAESGGSLDRSICATCRARIFEECRSLPEPGDR